MTDVVGLAMELPVAPGAGAAAPGAGAAFAAQLGQALGRLGDGQVVAAGVPGLQATALSPGLQVLTPVDAVTDPQALADFAKSQGIDESAVKWLFQLDAAAPTWMGQGAASVAMEGDGATGAGFGAATGVDGALSPGVGEPQTPTLGAGVGETLGLASTAMTPAALMLQRNVGAGQALAAVPTEPSAALVTDTPSGDGLATDVPTGGAGPDGQAPEGGDEASAAALAGLAVWTHERWGSDAQRTVRAEATTAQADPAYGLPQVDKAMRPELAAMVQKMVAAQDAGQRKATTHVDVLELDPELQADLRNWLDDGSLDLAPAEAPKSSSASSASAAAALAPQAAQAKTDAPPVAAPVSNAAERAEQLQQLAQRVGQAVGQRLVSMIERGHWNVKFMLKPQQLGEIEVDLRMRSGELDAAFRATNAFTRDLLQDGLPRLREVMSSMGMDVASMHVGNGQTQRDGGNPTPAFKASKGARPVQETRSGPETQAPARVVRQGGNGWDVMV
jgi:flagellar hook-length control protein FliK